MTDRAFSRVHSRISPHALFIVAALSACSACTRSANERGSANAQLAALALTDTLAAAHTDSARTIAEPTNIRNATRTGSFEHADIKESSAIVRSTRSPGVFWTLNDSGNDERLFAFDSSGASLGVIRVSGVRNRDWEALALGPCPDGHCLYIGEVGDNQARHETVTIWRIAEPPTPVRGGIMNSEVASGLNFRYPDGPRDVEAIWVDADTVVWLASKRRIRRGDGSVRPPLIYRIGADAWRAEGRVVTAEFVDSLPDVPVLNLRTQITDASLSNPFASESVASRLAIRTYGYVYVFEVSGTSGRPGALLARCDLRRLREEQGEAVTWLNDGRLFFSSEKKFAPLRAGHCP